MIPSFRPRPGIDLGEVNPAVSCADSLQMRNSLCSASPFPQQTLCTQPKPAVNSAKCALFYRRWVSWLLCFLCSLCAERCFPVIPGLRLTRLLDLEAKRTEVAGVRLLCVCRTLESDAQGSTRVHDPVPRRGRVEGPSRDHFCSRVVTILGLRC